MLETARAFLAKGYNVVATSRSVSKSTELPRSDRLVRVDGDIGSAETAAKVVKAAIDSFGTIDALVNNAGIFIAKPFTEFTAEDFRSLSSTNLEGYLYITQLAVKQMLKQKIGGSVIAITTSLLKNPLKPLTASVAMFTKGGLAAITSMLAMEYAADNIRFNAVAPGLVDTPLTKNNPKDFMKSLSPMGTLSDPKDIVDAIVYLTEARHITGETVHVDGGAHVGKW